MSDSPTQRAGWQHVAPVRRFAVAIIVMICACHPYHPPHAECVEVEGVRLCVVGFSHWTTGVSPHYFAMGPLQADWWWPR